MQSGINLNVMNNTKKVNPANFFMPGCMFIGMGIGFIFNAIPVGLLIGMGVGLLATGIYHIYHSKENTDGKAI